MSEPAEVKDLVGSHYGRSSSAEELGECVSQYGHGSNVSKPEEAQLDFVKEGSSTNRIPSANHGTEDKGSSDASLSLSNHPRGESASVASPEHFSNLPLRPFLPLYTAYGLVCGVQRAFAFVVPIFLMVASQRALNRAAGSFLPAAVYMLCSRGACFLFGPTVGKLLDWSSRFKAAATASVLYGLGTFLCAVWMPWLARVQPQNRATALPPGTMWFCLFGTVAALSEFALEISLWKRWLPLTVRAQQADHARLGTLKMDEPLAVANARMRRITMTIDIGMPLLVGWLLSSRGDVRGSILVARLGAIFLVVQLGALYIASRACARGESGNYATGSPDGAKHILALGSNQTAEDESTATQSTIPAWLAAARIGYQRLRVLFSSWRLYYEQKVFIASLAHASLYFTVLSPGGLLFGFLTYCGVSGRIIGLFRAASAIIGILATFSFEILVTRMRQSVLAVGRIGVVCQLVCLLPALVLLWLVPVPSQPLHPTLGPGATSIQKPPTLLIGVLVFVALSRWGLWCWDSSETEIMQTMVDAHAVGEVSAVEAALCSLAELLMYGVSVVLSSPRMFPALATMSALSVSTGAMIFHRWTRLQDQHQPRTWIAGESPVSTEPPV
ncbi:hypothetical protein CCYA_CCYA18G4449 [Cyanidiococcus yangmingshanensis]|nr:hypothetical protein CCYA_CCYA18G4449 [Cyanidiococcus yangmingshanensis]